MVDVQYGQPLRRELPLDELKRHPELAGMVLLQRSRLSVQPVTAAEWSFILQLGGIAPESI
jgi:predicted RNA-binding protein with PUA-like domain